MMYMWMASCVPIMSLIHYSIAPVNFIIVPFMLGLHLRHLLFANGAGSVDRFF